MRSDQDKQRWQPWYIPYWVLISSTLIGYLHCSMRQHGFVIHWWLVISNITTSPVLLSISTNFSFITYNINNCSVRNENRYSTNNKYMDSKMRYGANDEDPKQRINSDQMVVSYCVVLYHVIIGVYKTYLGCWHKHLLGSFINDTYLFCSCGINNWIGQSEHFIVWFHGNLYGKWSAPLVCLFLAIIVPEEASSVSVLAWNWKCRIPAKATNLITKATTAPPNHHPNTFQPLSEAFFAQIHARSSLMLCFSSPSVSNSSSSFVLVPQNSFKSRKFWLIKFSVVIPSTPSSTTCSDLCRTMPIWFGTVGYGGMMMMMMLMIDNNQ